MPSKQNNLPSVSLLILSTLGIIVGLITAVISAVEVLPISSFDIHGSTDLYPISTGMLSATIGVLNIPAFIISINRLRNNEKNHIKESLLPSANIFLIIWLFIVIAGFFISRSETWTILLAPLTITAILIPIWWLVEFSRRGLPRSTKLREWGTLTISLTTTPILTLLVELVLIIIVITAVIIGLGFQMGVSGQTLSIIEDLTLLQGGIEQLEQVLFELMQEPIIATAIFLTIGLIAPLIEEFFKPMALWFLLNRPITESEGFSLGLICGGAFALLESAGLVIQMSPHEWLVAISLRVVTSVLHIGLSGLVGYGLTRSRQKKQYGFGLLYIFAAAALHGAWNSLALFSGFSSSIFAREINMSKPSYSTIIPIVLMICLLISIIMITSKINRKLKKTLVEHTKSSE